MGCTSPIDRSTRACGTSSTSSPAEASTRPGPPGATLGLPAPCTTTSAHWSSSSPFITSTSARRTFTMRLGRTSRSCGFWLPRASASTSTRSPPTASVRALRSVVVATAWIRDAAAAEPGGSASSASVTSDSRTLIMIVSSSSLERMRRVGAQDEGGLEEDLVDLPGARLVVGEAVAVGSLGVLVAEPEAEELRGHEREVGPDGPLPPAHDRVLGPVVAEAGGPAGELPGAEGLHLAARVPAPAIASPGLVRRVLDAVAVGVLAEHVDAPDLVDRLPEQGQQRVLPALRAVPVLGVEAQQRVAAPLRGDPVGRRDPELQRALVAQLQERAEPGGHQRGVELAAAEGGVVVAVEDADQRLQEEGQGGEPGELGAALDQTLVAEEAGQHVGGVDEGPVVLVHRVEQTEAASHLAELELGAEGQRHQGQVGLGEVQVDLAGVLLARLHAHLRAGVGIDLAEERELDLAREEAVLAARKASRVGLVHVVLGEVADEVARDPNVEEELPGPALRVEREGLARARQLAGGEPHRGRGRRRSLRARRGRRGGRRRRGRRGRRGGLRAALDLLDAIAELVDGALVAFLHGVELLAHLLQLAAQLLDVLIRGGARGLRRGGPRRERADDEQADADE